MARWGSRKKSSRPSKTSSVTGAIDLDDVLIDVMGHGAHQTEEASRQLSLQVIELKQLIGAFRV